MLLLCAKAEFFLLSDSRRATPSCRKNTYFPGLGHFSDSRKSGAEIYSFVYQRKTNWGDVCPSDCQRKNPPRRAVPFLWPYFFRIQLPWSLVPGGLVGVFCSKSRTAYCLCIKRSLVRSLVPTYFLWRRWQLTDQFCFFVWIVMYSYSELLAMLVHCF